MTNLNEFIERNLESLLFSSDEYQKAEKLMDQKAPMVVWTSNLKYGVQISNEEEETQSELVIAFSQEGKLIVDEESKYDNGLILVGLLAGQNYFRLTKPFLLPAGMVYTREGMIARVLKERKKRAKRLEFKVKLGASRHGIHKLIDHNGSTHHIVVWDFDRELGYIDNIDWRTNKLGTTKHLMYFFSYIQEHPEKLRRLPISYPFIEITIDPSNGNSIRYFYNRTINKEEDNLLKKLFGNKTHMEPSQLVSKYKLIGQMSNHEGFIVREEVLDIIQVAFDNNQLMATVEEIEDDAYAMMKLPPFEYQKEGVAFCVFKKAVILGDEMGLGKSYQAIAIALLKKKYFNFSKTLIVCPASVKSQWKGEIEKFSKAKAIMIEGSMAERANQYLNSDNDVYFYITNYESVRRDILNINKLEFNFVILDEGQRIKNYNTKTANVIKSITKEHGLVLSGTPIENNLIDLYSIMLFLDKNVLTPQWELSQNHCIFDSNSTDKIVAYYNLAALKERMSPYIIRRQRKEVLAQLPEYIENNVYVSMTREQGDIHDYFKQRIASILQKKFKTPYDWEIIMHSLTSMRMVCDSIYLVDKTTHVSPKIKELLYLLNEQLDLLNTERKVIIFSEWTTMLDIIESTLCEAGYKIIKLTGNVPVKKRQKLIDSFNTDKDCKIFLSSEAGGAGLNLQVADTVINFELPWNPSKKNQRIGRVDRIGQKSDKIQVFNLIAPNSIETNIMAGLFMKQNLFEGVLNKDSEIDEVDFSSEGRSQFIRQLEVLISMEEEVELDELVDNTEDKFDLMEDNFEKEPRINNDDKANTEKFEQMETVLLKGMEFLSGIYQMSTGKPLGDGSEPTLSIDKETGEVTMKFRFGL
jgi:SNF2 family DNA or RNA helicase